MRRAPFPGAESSSGDQDRALRIGSCQSEHASVSRDVPGPVQSQGEATILIREGTRYARVAIRRQRLPDPTGMPSCVIPVEGDCLPMGAQGNESGMSEFCSGQQEREKHINGDSTAKSDLRQSAETRAAAGNGWWNTGHGHPYGPEHMETHACSFPPGQSSRECACGETWQTDGGSVIAWCVERRTGRRELASRDEPPAGATAPNRPGACARGWPCVAVRSPFAH